MIRRHHARQVVHLGALLLIGAGLFPAAVFAQNGSWITNTAGTYNWSQAGNWQNGIIADGADNTADFATAGLTGPMTINLDTQRTIGSLVFDNPTNTFDWSVTGSNPLTLSSSAAGGPTIAINNPQITATVSTQLAGTQGLTTTGPGTLTLSGMNSYSGGTNVQNGTVQVVADAALGTGNVTGAALGTVNFTGTTTTTRSFAMNGGTVSVAAGKTLTFNGNVISSAFLDGAGTFATSATNGAQFVNVTATQSVAITSNSAVDQLVHFTNNGSLTVAGGIGTVNSTLPPSAAVTFSGFTNQGLGSITIEAASPGSSQSGTFVNVSNFQSYGILTISNAVPGSGQFSLLTNVGTAPLAFDAGSRTFVGTPVPEGPPAFVAGIDLDGPNAVIAGGLFVNNGFIVDVRNGATGTATVIVDYGSLYKGAGYTGVPVVTQNGGKVQAGNSPGTASFGRFVFGPGGVSNYVFAIDDATGTAGANSNANGWGLVKAVQQSVLGTATSSGNFIWTAAPTAKLTVAIDTIIGTTTGDTDEAGPMANFDPTRAYSWLAAQWAGTYSGPTDAATLDAATSFDTSGFLNPIAGTFGWSLDPAGQILSLVYTPSSVPEPATLGLVGAAAAAGLACWRRQSAKHDV